jgi:hypothetical protein
MPASELTTVREHLQTACPPGFDTRFRIPGLCVILTGTALFRTENPEIVVPLDAVFE